MVISDKPNSIEKVLNMCFLFFVVKYVYIFGDQIKPTYVKEIKNRKKEDLFSVILLSETNFNQNQLFSY